jgi:hypothetical protein
MSDESGTPETVSVTLPATVEKVIKSPYPDEPDKAHIVVVDGAPELYREIRIDNTLQNDQGEEVELKPGAEVDVTVEAPVGATKPKVA